MTERRDRREATVEVILVPFDVERTDTGAARAPRELVARGFLGGLERAGWRVHQTEIGLQREGARRAEAVAEIGRGIARAVANAHSRQRFPLVLSGSCLCAVGVVTGLQRMGRELEVVWIDAHGDFNTPESTPSGYWDGMALAAVCGRSLPEVYKAVELRPIHFRNVVHLAGRAFDPPEIEDIARLNLAVIPPGSIHDSESAGQLRRELLARQGEGGRGRQAGHRELYLHVDMDGLDPHDAPAVQYPEPGGPALADVLRALEGLPAPAAMTLAGMSFDRVDAEGSQRMVDTCLSLVDSFLPR